MPPVDDEHIQGAWSPARTADVALHHIVKQEEDIEQPLLGRPAFLLNLLQVLHYFKQLVVVVVAKQVYLGLAGLKPLEHPVAVATPVPDQDDVPLPLPLVVLDHTLHQTALSRPR